MKKFYIYILIFCFVFLACSCVKNDNSRLPDASENDQGTAEVNSIKESVLKLMSDSESQQDPAILFSHFDGDFEISLSLISFKTDSLIEFTSAVP